MKPFLEGLYQHIKLRKLEYIKKPGVIGNVLSIDKAVENIKKKVGEKQGKPTKDRIQEALTILFKKGPKIALYSHLRYICWGLLEPFGDTNRCLITEPVLFDQTIDELQLLKPSEIPISALRGLLAAYFGLAHDSVNPNGLKNWLELRQLLSKRLKNKKDKTGFHPIWLQVISEHANLLSENPCDRYGHSLLSDNDSILKPLREELRIPADSWFWRELFLSQINVAIKQNDEEFITLLDKLLPQISKFTFSANEALKMVLERYYQGSNRNIQHLALSTEVINAWGSPHLERNARWGLVKSEAKLMVKNWLVVKALDDFFRLLQEDQAADERRLSFWLRYQQSIDYFHFALGPDAHTNSQKDYLSFRTRFRDHICRLSSPGKSDNNAFILKLGDFWVVEFGVVGNACFIYEKDGIPFDIGTKSLDLNFLKDKKKAIYRLSHMSGWEWDFEHKLKEIGIHPDNHSGASNIVAKTATNSKLEHQITKPRVFAYNLNVDPLTAGKKVAEDYHIEIEDHTAKGGAFWVLWKSEKGPIADKLRHCGFKYYQSRGWWKKK